MNFQDLILARTAAVSAADAPASPGTLLAKSAPKSALRRRDARASAGETPAVQMTIKT
jgi:hypothetical protein